MEERNKMLNMVDPNHENFNQCACGRLLKRDNIHNCWVSNCEQNQSVCKHCFKHKDAHVIVDFVNFLLAQQSIIFNMQKIIFVVSESFGLTRREIITMKNGKICLKGILRKFFVGG